MKLTLCYF